MGEGRGRDTQYEQKYRKINRQYNQSAEGRARGRNRSNRRSPLTPAFSLLTCKKEQNQGKLAPSYLLCLKADVTFELRMGNEQGEQLFSPVYEFWLRLLKEEGI